MPVNKQLPGRVLFTCTRCGKQMWLTPEIRDKVYKDGVCLDCRQGKKG